MRLKYYVRCPLYNEPADYIHPRCFMLAQLQEYNEISEEYTVLPHDLLGTAKYYLAENRSMVYPRNRLERCAGSIGSKIRCKKGDGIILAHSEPTNDDPYLYYIKLSSGWTALKNSQQPPLLVCKGKWFLLLVVRISP